MSLSLVPSEFAKKKMDSRLMCLKAAEKTAEAAGFVLLPAICVHHKRRNPERRMTLFQRAYYLVPECDMTPGEFEKFRVVCSDKKYFRP